MAITKVSRGLLSTGVSDSSDATAITIDSSEKVGLNGLSAGDYWATSNQLVFGNTASAANGGMTIATATNAVGQIYFADGTSGDARYRGQIQYTHVSDAMDFATAASFAMRIDSSGKVGIGTSAPAAVLDVVSSGTTSTAFRVLKSGTSTQNLHAATEISGHGRYSIYDASENEDIRFDSNGDSYFNGGQFNVGQTGSTSATKVTFNAGAQHGQFIDNVGNSYAAITVKSDSNNNFFPLYMVTGTAGVKGYILTNSSGTEFNTSGSDERLKENIVDWNESVLDSFKSIKPKTFNFKDDENKTNVKGYIAQNEVDKFPEAYPINPRDDMHYFNPTGMTVYLMKAIQELSAKVEELEGKIE